MFKPKKTKDRKTVDRSNIFTTGQIGRTRETTPEGYLLCRDVPLARIGTLMYGKGEVPVTADDTDLILIQRGEQDLFDPITIASFEGKSVTDDHPDDWVSPENWKELTVGTAQNVRRGEQVDSDFLIADLLITDKAAIQKVIDGKVEISLGYDADYQEISKGKGVQSNIIGNHVALVDKGRCGSRCSIGDSFMADKKATKKRASIGDRIRQLIFTRDAEEAEKLAKEVEDEELEEGKTKTGDEDPDDEPEDGKTKTGDSAFQAEMRKFMKTMDKRMSALEKKKTKDSDDPEKKTEDEEEDEEGKTKDDILEAEEGKKLPEEGVKNYTGDSLKEVLSRAEILSPGIKLPTMDSVNNGKAVLNAKRSALKTAYATTDGEKIIAPFVGHNPNFDTMSAATIDAAFIGASELMRQTNNAKGVRSGISTKDFGRAPMSISDINAQNRQFWANRGK
ncbi:DUF2213 domain-containing protein [Acinetobacter baumannii]